MDDIFNWNYKTSRYTDAFFWFEVNEEGKFGYRMSSDPDRFEVWDREDVERERPTWLVVSTRKELYGPFMSDVPPIILKIRIMEIRWKRFQQNKRSEA